QAQKPAILLVQAQQQWTSVPSSEQGAFPVPAFVELSLIRSLGSPFFSLCDQSVHSNRRVCPGLDGQPLFGQKPCQPLLHFDVVQYRISHHQSQRKRRSYICVWLFSRIFMGILSP